MDFKVFSQNDMISVNIDSEKPKVEAETKIKKDNGISENVRTDDYKNCVDVCHDKQFENELVEKSLEAIEKRSTILEGKSLHICILIFSSLFLSFSFRDNFS